MLSLCYEYQVYLQDLNGSNGHCAHERFFAMVKKSSLVTAFSRTIERAYAHATGVAHAIDKTPVTRNRQDRLVDCVCSTGRMHISSLDATTSAPASVPAAAAAAATATAAAAMRSNEEELLRHAARTGAGRIKCQVPDSRGLSNDRPSTTPTVRAVHHPFLESRSPDMCPTPGRAAHYCVKSVFVRE